MTLPVTNSEQKPGVDSGAKLFRRPDNVGEERLCEAPVSFAFSFPLCDLLIEELQNPPEYKPDPSENQNSASCFSTAVIQSSVTSDSAPTSLVPCSALPLRQRIRFRHFGPLSAYVYQKVISRRAVPFQPNPKNPKHILYYVEEQLACGHTVTVHPIDGETLTARKRSCHECSRALQLAAKKASMSEREPRPRRQAGFEGYGPFRLRFALRFAFAVCAVVAFALAIIPPRTHYRVLRQYGTYDFQIQEVSYGRPHQPFVWHGCHDFRPEFEVGFTLTQFNWVINGQCSEIAPEFVRPAYVIERRSDGLPTVPSNCVNSASAPSFCNGEPKFD